MREIKFRAWDNVHKSLGYRMVYHGEQYNLKTLGDFWQWIGQHNPMPIEQFTGLKDKNGKDIYEGDIVKHEHFYPSEVVFSEDGAFKFEDFSWVEYGKEYPNEWEVIGNIHENPELLGAK